MPPRVKLSDREKSKLVSYATRFGGPLSLRDMRMWMDPSVHHLLEDHLEEHRLLYAEAQAEHAKRMARIEARQKELQQRWQEAGDDPLQKSADASLQAYELELEEQELDGYWPAEVGRRLPEWL